MHRRAAGLADRPVLLQGRPQQLGAERPELAHPLQHRRGGPGPQGHVEPEHGDGPAGPEYHRGGLRVGPDVVLGGGRDVAPARRPAHDHESAHPVGQPRLPPRGQRDVGQRPRRDQRDLAGGSAHGIDDVVHGVPSGRAGRGRRQRGPAQPGIAVYLPRVERRAQQRPGAARGHRRPGRADELAYRQRVGRRLGQPDVAGHGGDADQVDAGVPVRERDRERVVDPGIAVEDDSGGHVRSPFLVVPGMNVPNGLGACPRDLRARGCVASSARRSDMHIPPIPAVENSDPEIARLIQDEARRQYEKARLIPSENYVSVAVLEASGSVLTNKYSEGYPGRRYYEGQQFIDQIETIARDRAKALFGVDHANVQPYSGSPANLAVYLAFAEPGDTVMGMALPMGGHLTHGWSVSATGKWFRAVQYGVRHDTGRVDLDEVRDLALKERPKIIFCGGTAIPRTIDFPSFAAIAAEAGALLVADIAHISGLIAGGAHPSPVGHADVITTTTHKTLRGPRGAMIMSKAEHAAAVDRAVFPGLQGGPHNHTTAAIAVALREAAQPSFSDYAHQVVANAKALAAALLDRGYSLVSGGTDNHLILIDLTPQGIAGKPAAKALDRAGLEVNYNTVPFDPRKPFDPSGLRIGTPAITTRGLREEHMAPLAAWMDEAVTAATKDDEATLERIAGQVRDLLASFPAPGWAS